MTGMGGQLTLAGKPVVPITSRQNVIAINGRQKTWSTFAFDNGLCAIAELNVEADAALVPVSPYDESECFEPSQEDDNFFARSRQALASQLCSGC